MSIGKWYVYGLHGLRLWIVPNYYFIITYLLSGLRQMYDFWFVVSSNINYINKKAGGAFFTHYV